MRFTLFLPLLIFFGCASSSGVESARELRSNARNATLQDVTDNIKSAISADPVPVRIYFRGDCESRADHFREVQFPKIELSLPPSGSTTVDRVRSMFRNNNYVTVNQEYNRIIRIKIYKPNEDILLTEIPLIQFTPEEQYNRRQAITVIDTSPEVLKTANELGINRTLGPVFDLIVPPQEGLPSLPSKIENVTMDEALDIVATKFRSMISFGICESRYTIRDLGRVVN